MQIPCHKLYEEEKKQNEGKSIGVLYNQVYELSKHCDRYYNWKYTNFVFGNTDDNIVVYFHYKTYGQTARGGYGNIEYDFYVIENNGKYYIRYFNMYRLQSEAAEYGKQAITNLAWCDEMLIGVNTTEYRKYVFETAMSDRIPLDKSELEKNLNAIQQIDFESACGGLDYLEYLYAETKVEMLDFKNKITFYSDEYVLPKFTPCIQFIEFIFEKCKIPCVKKCNLKYIDNLEKAKEIIVDKTIKRKYHIL